MFVFVICVGLMAPQGYSAFACAAAMFKWRHEESPNVVSQNERIPFPKVVSKKGVGVFVRRCFLAIRVIFCLMYHFRHVGI